MAPSPSQQLEALEEIISSTLALINHFLASHAPSGANKSTAQSGKPIDNPPNPLHVLRDSASLLKAHVTKVSLLAINEPFTPSAVTKVFQELTGTCLPAMMGAAQICEDERTNWGTFMGEEVQARVRRVLREIDMLLREVQSLAQGTVGTAGRDSLSSTGIVWESCDALIELEKIGIAGLAVQKAEQYRDTIKDAITELQEWTEADDPANEEQNDQLLGSDDEGVEGDRDSIEVIFHAANSLPADRPELKKLAADAIEKLKKIVLLYNALIKRRLTTFTILSGNEWVAKPSSVYLDELMMHLRALPHMVDELASNFYYLNEAVVQAMMRIVINEAVACSRAAKLDYDGKEDMFSPWTKKWQEATDIMPSTPKG